jgi:hypothetical protein
MRCFVAYTFLDKFCYLLFYIMRYLTAMYLWDTSTNMHLDKSDLKESFYTHFTVIKHSKVLLRMLNIVT